MNAEIDKNAKLINENNANIKRRLIIAREINIGDFDWYGENTYTVRIHTFGYLGRLFLFLFGE